MNIFIQPHSPIHLRPKENSFALSIPMDWDLCTVCQKVSSDQAPADVYSAFLDNVKKFKDLNPSPVDVDYGEHGTVQACVQHNVSWHQQCHQKFNNSMLERARQKQSRKRKSAEGGATDRSKRSKRKPNLVNTHCIFVMEQPPSHYMSSLPLMDM